MRTFTCVAAVALLYGAGITASADSPAPGSNGDVDAAGSKVLVDAAGSMVYVDVAGSKVYVETFGSGSPILFLHGGLDYFDTMFVKQRDYFAATHRVIGVDRPGYGHSPDNGQPFSYQKMADDTAALIEALGVAPIDVVGMSDGGNIGLILAHDHPALVRRLVISGANLRAGLSASELLERAQWSQQQILEKAHQLEAHLPPNLKRDYQAVAPDGAGHWDQFLAKSYRLWLTPVIIEPAALKTIQTPVLVIAGDHDFTSLEETSEIFRGLPHAQLLVVPGAAHATLLEAPELVNLAIRNFLGAR